jgi:hypothetical protein
MKKTSVFSIIKTLHLAMLAGQVIFTAVIFYLIYSKMKLPILVEHEKLLQVVALVFVTVTIFAGNRLFKKKLLVLNEDVQTATKDKMLAYRTICLIQWALLEAGVLLCGIFALLTANYAFLAVSVIIIIYFALLTPVKDKIAAQLNLNSTELDAL